MPAGTILPKSGPEVTDTHRGQIGGSQTLLPVEISWIFAAVLIPGSHPPDILISLVRRVTGALGFLFL